ncbi:MAG: translation initiation factor IF-2 subunit alpha [archaeon GB-1867-005]|nr:translation initiation factor IF-2 subunit alpha [Candidatus Culexmicrobium cathedralense]
MEVYGLVRRRRPLPELGELVMATVAEVFDRGAYVILDEYGEIEGYVPIGEVSSSWVHNIRDFLKEGRKVVLKVIRVDPRKGHVDLSLRRVTAKERKEKLLEWKRLQRAEKFLEMAADRLGKTLDEAYEEAGWPMEDYFGEIFAGFEAAAMKGVEPLLKAGVPGKWAEVLAELAKAYIELPEVKISGILQLTSAAPDGVLRVKEALMKAAEAGGKYDISFRIYTVGSPRYRIDITARNYQIAEAAMESIVKAALNTIKKLGGQGSFTRV